ncbi:hypothetical protein L6452_02038 [Arctium lappa]|uniref:Uncharacterized protein n=1 Tax=Arctium lappa TaxID=4217 RepID=A0ACB9FJA0_ARCLA|nr:hypothetical protein L6452_02038 [Arctium lappa]
MIPQAFARMSAVYGGTYMLNKPECKVTKVGKVARAICIMSHPLPNTNYAHSTQVILPQKQLGRKSDMDLLCCSYSHNVAPKGKYIAFVTTEAKTDIPEQELKPGIDLLGPVDQIFFDTYDRYEPTNKGVEDQCFISTLAFGHLGLGLYGMIKEDQIVKLSNGERLDLVIGAIEGVVQEVRATVNRGSLGAIQ